MNIRIFWLFTILFLLVAGTAIAQNSDDERAALEASRHWLGLVDDGEFRKSWDEAASYFKKIVELPQWEKSIEPVRTPLGKIVSRKVASITYETSLPGAPDGEYYVIQFDTSFENKKTALETITPMRDKDGSWRVSGYYIK
jgi:hypothetical protein